MSYETNVGNALFIFTISIPATFQLISECMSAEQLSQLGNLKPLDGYIVPAGDVEIAHENPQVIGAVESCASGTQISFPIVNWHQKVFIKSVSGTVAGRMKIIV